MNIRKIRPKLQFELWNDIKRKISESPEIKYLNYKQKLNYSGQVCLNLIKQLETKMSEIDIQDKYPEILGELILHEDIGNSFNNNCFDALILNDKRKEISKINFGDEILKVNWKNVQPKGTDKTVSLPENLIKKYILEKVSVIFLIKNSSDPNYYSNLKNMYFPEGKITTDGYQYYILHYKNFYLGKKGTFGNLYYPIKSNGLMINMGLRFKEQQSNLNDFKGGSDEKEN